jgi:hypothetical protein
VARVFVDDGVDLYRVKVFRKDGTYAGTLGPYANFGDAKRQGSRETGTSCTAYLGKEGSYKVQKLEAVLEWNKETQLHDAVLKWSDVNG